MRSWWKAADLKNQVVVDLKSRLVAVPAVQILVEAATLEQEVEVVAL
jgi:hypothetical protein